MKLLNIHNRNRLIYLFLRDEKGNLIIEEDNTFHPYFYEQDPQGKFNSYDGKKLRKIYCSKPSDVPKLRSKNSYESDILFTNRYLLDRVKELEKTTIKCAFVDMEILSDEYPNPIEAKFPISCISVYNCLHKSVQSFYLGDYSSEFELIEAFIKYMQKERFDLWLIWNGDNFDMPYLINRIPDFCKKVSPIGQERYAIKGQLYPAGISIIDYMALDKKITLNRKSQYSLDARLQEVIGRGKEIKKLDFGKLSLQIKQRCENDVKDMAKMEEKLQYIPLWDGIRRLTKVKFEDYYFNSRMIDQLLLQEGKNKKIVLPMKPTKEDEGEDFEAAFREIYKKGTLFNRGSYDLAGAYLNAIIEFCLDPANTFETVHKDSNLIPINVTDRITNKIITTYYIEQNPDSLLPTIAKKLLEEKNKFKKLKNETNPESDEYKDIEEKYKSWKSISLSAWGVIGNKYFRYYDPRVASMITSIVRDVLHYVIDELKKLDYQVEYIDTDGMIINDKGKNIVDLLNKLIQQWSHDRFNKGTDIHFDYEGNYEKLLLVALCRYKGYLRRDDGTLEEKTVGIESKRKDSTVFMKKFQTKLIEKMLNQETKESIIKWIKEQIITITETSLEDIAFPVKLSRKPEEYKTEITRNYKDKEGNTITKTFKRKPYITVRALENANLKKKVGQLFYYIYCKNDEGKSKPIAFDEQNKGHIKNIDWKKTTERNIHKKAKILFTAMDWDYSELLPVVIKKRRKKSKKIKGGVL